MRLETKKEIISHHFKNKETIAFFIKKNKIKNNSKKNKQTLIDKELLKKYKKINQKVTKNIITSYQDRANFLRIVFNKEYVLRNNKEVYNFLKDINKKLK